MAAADSYKRPVVLALITTGGQEYNLRFMKANTASTASLQKTSKLVIPILSLIMMVNALSYGTIIPLLYPYGARFGLNGFGMGLLFSSFSLFQFLATPVIGRLSDRYGRKPLLLFSLFGTALSQLLFAAAQNAPQLFLARILDGITGGNNSVAQAVIADTLQGEERTKAFGMLGASFGVGFLVGPALGGVLSGISMAAPFWFSAFLAMVGVVLGWLLLPETLPSQQGRKSKLSYKPQELINLPLLWHALTKTPAGPVLLVTFLGMTSHQALVIGFQSFTFDVLRLNTTQVGLLFASIGLVSVVTQAFGIGPLLKAVPSQTKLLRGSLLACAGLCFGLFGAQTVWPFVLLTMVYVAAYAPQNIVLTGLLSHQTKAEDQGGIMGVQQSYLSLGQIIGPIVAGFITGWSVSAVFVVAAILFLISLYSTQQLRDSTKPSVDI